MRIEEFVAGNRKKCYEYSCFIPSLVNHEWTWESQSLTVSLEKAVEALASLDACSQFVPDIGLFIRMHIVHEASVADAFNYDDGTLVGTLDFINEPCRSSGL